MLREFIEDLEERERIVASEMRPLADDLRLLDVGQIAAFVAANRPENVASLVQSSIELVFNPGFLRFNRVVQLEISWERRPNVVLGLEFHHAQVHVYLRMALEAHWASVEIDYIYFDDPTLCTSDATSVLACALNSARRLHVLSGGHVSTRRPG